MIRYCEEEWIEVITVSISLPGFDAYQVTKNQRASVGKFSVGFRGLPSGAGCRRYVLRR